MVGKLDMEQNKDGWRVYVKNKEGDKTSIKKKRKKKQNKKGKIIWLNIIWLPPFSK